MRHVSAKPAPAAAATVPARNDPIAALLAPSQRVLAVQRALAEFGYGQIKPTGVVGPETQVAIEKFERDHHQPVTGEISDRLLREMATMTGRTLE
jgi:peptidoglycan hydrolase-like protein with peptidoglycan-binding domain